MQIKATLLVILIISCSIKGTDAIYQVIESNSETNSKEISEIVIQDSLRYHKACDIKKAGIRDTLLLIWPADNSDNKGYQMISNGKYIKTYPPMIRLKLICDDHKANRKNALPLKFNLKTIKAGRSEKLKIQIEGYKEVLMHDFSNNQPR